MRTISFWTPDTFPTPKRFEPHKQEDGDERKGQGREACKEDQVGAEAHECERGFGGKGEPCSQAGNGPHPRPHCPIHVDISSPRDRHGCGQFCLGEHGGEDNEPSQ